MLVYNEHNGHKIVSVHVIEKSGMGIFVVVLEVRFSTRMSLAPFKPSRALQRKKEKKVCRYNSILSVDNRLSVIYTNKEKLCLKETGFHLMECPIIFCRYGEIENKTKIGFSVDYFWIKHNSIILQCSIKKINKSHA